MAGTCIGADITAKRHNSADLKTHLNRLIPKSRTLLQQHISLNINWSAQPVIVSLTCYNNIQTWTSLTSELCLLSALQELPFKKFNWYWSKLMFIMTVPTHCTSSSSHLHALWVFHCQPQGGDNSPDISSFLFPMCDKPRETSHLNHWTVWKKHPIRSKVPFEFQSVSSLKHLDSWLSPSLGAVHSPAATDRLWPPAAPSQSRSRGLSSGLEISALYASCSKWTSRLSPHYWWGGQAWTCLLLLRR